MLLLALILRDEPEAVDAGVFAPGPGPPTGESAEVALALGNPAAGEKHGEPDADGPTVHRVEVEASAATAPPAAPEPAPLQGFVLDASGRPLADTVLYYLSGSPGAARFEGRAGEWVQRLRARSGRRSRLTTRTNAHGEFAFDGPNRKAGGAILFRPRDYVDGYVVAPVDPESDWQSLQALAAPHQDSTVRFWLTGVEFLAPVEVESVQIAHVRGNRDYPRRIPWESERTIELGDKATEVLQRGLAPGVWRFTFGLRHGLPQRVDVTIEEVGSVRELTLLVESWPDAISTEIEFEAEANGSLPWVDGSSGMQDWLPAERIRIGERRRDRHFAQTLRLGHGSVKAAELTLILRPIHGMSRNDGIYLEHLGQHQFAWGSLLADLFGGRWQSTEPRALHLDLARLPLKGEETFDLRPYLEDGLLDVVIQDDTAIEHISIRIVR